MKRLIATFCFCLLLFSVSFSQEAQKLDEIGYVNCGYFMALVDSVYATYSKSTNSKLYVIYYEQTAYAIYTKGYPRRKETVLVKPRKGDALSKAKEIGIYLKAVRNLPESQINYVDGGFRETFALEVYLLPNGGVPPKPTPTISQEAFVFRKGKLRSSRDCSKAYDRYGL